MLEEKEKNAKTKNKNIKLYSFDIFDTLVTRRVAEPIGIFTIVQEKLKEFDLSVFLKNNFTQIRIGAEEYAHSNSAFLHKHWEISINEIYTVIQNNYNLTNDMVQLIKNIEIKTEIENLVPINKNINKLKQLLEEKKRVVLISDMYYSSEELRLILKSVDPIFANLKIYTSSDKLCAKHEGKLYEIVRNEEQVNFNNWIHVGDNEWADIKNAKNKGIKTKLYKRNELKSYQQYLLNQSRFDAFSQLSIGASNLSVLNMPNYVKKTRCLQLRMFFFRSYII